MNVAKPCAEEPSAVVPHAGFCGGRRPMVLTVGLPLSRLLFFTYARHEFRCEF